MWHLHHFPLCAFSRKIRLVLAEYRLDFDLISTRPWDGEPDFLAMNPAGLTPVLTSDEDERVLSDSGAIFEYLSAQYASDVSLLGDTDLAAAEARRLAAWFDVKFYTEVTAYAFAEKVAKRFITKAPPNAKAVRAASHNLKTHLDYIEHLFARRSWLAGDRFTIADIAAAAHIS
ncbi:MAG: glutathione S-transferase family protein, partial [Pseudomonadota bacterium]